MQRNQSARHSVLNVDACNLHEPTAFFVEGLEGRGVAGELRTPAASASAQDKPSPGLDAFNFTGIANDVQRFSRGGHHEQEVQSKAAVLLRADTLSGAADFFQAFFRFLSNCPT